MDYDDLRERAERSTGAEREAWERALRQLRDADAARQESKELLAEGARLRAGVAGLVSGYARAQRILDTMTENPHV